MTAEAALYDRIGAGYDATRRADPRIADRLLALLDAAPGATILDLACGTGNYGDVAARAGLRVVGLDRSPRMLAAAAAKGVGLKLVAGDAAALPFADGRFQGALCTLALHHFPRLGAACRELRRVLAAGRAVFFTATPEQMGRYWLRHYFPDLIARSAAAMPPFAEVAHALAAAGFGGVRAEPFHLPADLVDLFLYSGKHRPEIYLDARVRAGISSFATAAGAEVATGLARLAADIASGAIQEIIAAADDAAGDYLFIQAEAG